MSQRALPYSESKHPKAPILFAILGIAGALLCLVAWAFASPVGSSPDDDFHLASIWCQNANTNLCQPSSQPDSKLVSSQLTSIYCFAHQPQVSANCQWNALNFAGPLVETKRGNFSNEYPSGFYSAMSILANDDPVGNVLSMRLLNSAIFIACLVVALLVGTTQAKKWLPWGWLLVASPLALFLIPSTNPSSWAITGVGFSWFFLLQVGLQSGWRRWVSMTMFLICALLATQSRADASVFVVLASALVLFVWWREIRSKLLTLGLTIAAGCLASITLLTTHQLSAASTSGLVDQDVATQNAGGIGLLGFNAVQLPEYFAGMLGLTGLGWTDTELPATVWLNSSIVVAMALFLVLGKLSRRQAAAFFVVIGLVVAIALFMFQVAGAHVGAIVQPRYLFPLVVSVTGVFWYVGTVDMGLLLSRLQMLVLALLIGCSAVVALYVNLSRYLQGQQSGFSPNLNSTLMGVHEWWFAPLPPMQVWILGSIGLVLALVSALIPLSQIAQTPGGHSHRKKAASGSRHLTR